MDALEAAGKKTKAHQIRQLLKELRIRIHHLKNGVSSKKPLWRHTAKLLRA